ncbi:AMP-binding protein, partial [Streptomyces sp. NRRL S-1022]
MILASAGTQGPVVPVSGTLHALFEEQAARTPDAVAVVAGGVSLSYREVDERANRLAWHLRSLGVGAESLVGVCLERGPALVPALIGVLKSGAAYLPLDPVNPAERLSFMLGDAGARVVVTESGLLPVLDGFEGERVVLDELESERVDALPGVSGPDNAVYVIYTSGSTGRPKGVVLSHANVVRLLETAQEHYAFDGSDVWSMFHSYAFDVSVFEMWG